MIQRINGVLAAALLAFSIWGYRRLPARIPTHFGVNGEPDGYGSPSSFLVLPLLAVLTVGILVWSCRMIRRNPALVNMPGKKQFLELPEHEQQTVLDIIVSLIHLLATATLVLFGFIQIMTYRAATGHEVGAAFTAMLVTLIAMTVALPVIMLVRVQRATDAATRRVKIGGVIR